MVKVKITRVRLAVMDNWTMDMPSMSLSSSRVAEMERVERVEISDRIFKRLWSPGIDSKE